MDRAAAPEIPRWDHVQRMFMEYLLSRDPTVVSQAVASLRRVDDAAAFRSIALELEQRGRVDVATQVRELIR